MGGIRDLDLLGLTQVELAARIPPFLIASWVVNANEAGETSDPLEMPVA